MRLDGIRVLDLSRLLPGPFATQLLADSGAEIIKIEDTDKGDYARQSKPQTSRGVGPIFEMVNRGKKSVSINLKAEAGRTAFYELVNTADVVFEGFRPGVAEKLGVGYDKLTEYADDIIYCSLSGYGGDGPWASRAGHDINYISLAGLLDMTRESERAKPQIPGYPIADMASGLFAAFAITQGILSRELGNSNGEYIDIAMSDVVASFSQPVAHHAFSEDNPRPGATDLTGNLPCYDVYETKDGKWVSFGALEPQFWEAFCKETGNEELIDHHRTDDEDVREAVRIKLEEIFIEKTRSEWEAQLREVNTAFAGVYSPGEMVNHDQIESRNIITRSKEAPARISYPAETRAKVPSHNEALPDLGEHTEQYLKEVGYTKEELADLMNDGVIR